MKKAESLRRHLEKTVPAFKKSPESLHVFIEKGQIAARWGSTSFEYRYDVNLVVTDFADHADTLIIPLMVWIQDNQPDLLLHPDKMENLIRFEAEIIDHDKTDLSLTISLVEAVSVSEVSPGKWQATHREEPKLPDTTGPIGWELYLHGELIASGSNA